MRTKITVEIPDNLYKIDCSQIDCTNNLINHSTDEWRCNLRKIIIGQDGKCEDFAPMNKGKTSD